MAEWKVGEESLQLGNENATTGLQNRQVGGEGKEADEVWEILRDEMVNSLANYGK